MCINQQLISAVVVSRLQQYSSFHDAWTLAAATTTSLLLVAELCHCHTLTLLLLLLLLLLLSLVFASHVLCSFGAS
jgi:hypothetical protein